MSYQNSIYLLPEELLEQVQEYVEGRVIYIPKKKSNKKCWGTNTDTKAFLASRNSEISDDYKKGMTMKQLSEKYFLTEKSIRRILRQQGV